MIKKYIKNMFLYKNISLYYSLLIIFTLLFLIFRFLFVPFLIKKYNDNERDYNAARMRKKKMIIIHDFDWYTKQKKYMQNINIYILMKNLIYYLKITLQHIKKV